MTQIVPTTLKACAETPARLERDTNAPPAAWEGHPDALTTSAARYQVFHDTLQYALRAVASENLAQAKAFTLATMDAAALYRSTRDGSAFMDPVTRDLVESLCYDVGKLSYGTMRDEPGGQALYKDWDALTNRLRGS